MADIEINKGYIFSLKRKRRKLSLLFLQAEGCSSAGEDAPLLSPFLKGPGHVKFFEHGFKLSKEERQQLGSPRYTPLKNGEVLLGGIFDTAQGEICITINKLYTTFANYINTDIKLKISMEIANPTDPPYTSAYRQFSTGTRKWKNCIEFSDEFAFTLLENFLGPYVLKFTLCIMPPRGILAEVGKASLSIFVGESSAIISDVETSNAGSTLILIEDIINSTTLIFQPLEKVFLIFNIFKGAILYDDACISTV